MCALLHVIYDRDNLRFGVGSIADSGVTSALAEGEDLGNFTCRRLGIVMAIA